LSSLTTYTTYNNNIKHKISNPRLCQAPKEKETTHQIL